MRANLRGLQQLFQGLGIEWICKVQKGEGSSEIAKGLHRTDPNTCKASTEHQSEIRTAFTFHLGKLVIVCDKSHCAV